MQRAASRKLPIRKAAFTLVELLVVVAIVGVLAALLLPALSRGKAAARQGACLSNLRQIGVGLGLLLGENEDRFPDRRDLKQQLGYRSWTTWPPSDPRGGWAAVVLSNHVAEDRIWRCPSLEVSGLGALPQAAQYSRPGDGASLVSYWLWRFDRTDDPVPLDNFWGKSTEQAVEDLRRAGNPGVGRFEGPADVELAVDPYFPNTVASLPAEVRGRAVHARGRNRLMLDFSASFVRDPRLTAGGP